MLGICIWVGDLDESRVWVGTGICSLDCSGGRLIRPVVSSFLFGGDGVRGWGDGLGMVVYVCV